MDRELQNHFPELRRLAKEQGLFEKAPVKSMVALLVAIAAYLAIFASFIFVQSWWYIIIASLALTIVSGQFGFLMHDAGHRQVFKATWKNNVFGYIATFFNGTSFASWREGHNEHHEHPNVDDLDPDIDVFFVAYTEKQVDDAHPVMQFFYRYQAWYATLMYTFVYYFMRYGSLFRLFQKNPPRIIAMECFLMVLWHVGYFGGLYVLLGLPKMLVFAVIHHALTGLHLALAFAPNHKGMPIFEADNTLNWFAKQVLTARNIYGSPVTNFLFGGLNFQIEHHLFPTMPRIHLCKAQKLTEEFCRKQNVEYYETGIIQSYKEVYSHLASVAHYARNLRRPATELRQQLAHILEELQETLKELEQSGEHPHFADLQKRMYEYGNQFSQKLQNYREERQQNILRKQREARELIATMRRYIKPLRSS